VNSALPVVDTIFLPDPLGARQPLELTYLA
jgi:hypothetical protein